MLLANLARKQSAICFVLLMHLEGAAFCQHPSQNSTVKRPGNNSLLKDFLNFLEDDPLRLQESLPEDWTNWALVISEVRNEFERL